MSIQIENLQHIYNQGTPFESVALKDINLEIEHNDFVAIIGSTGSGKSTLIQHLNGLLKATNSDCKINIYGKDLYKDKLSLKEIRRKVGIVFQYPEHQLFETTVFKDVAFGPKNIGFSEDEVEKSVKYALSLVGIGEEFYEKSPFELSGGQKRKVAIAGVIAMKPEVLVLDEPVAGLDPKSKNDLFNTIRQMKKELNITIILVSHSMDDVSEIADKVIVMDKGTVVIYDEMKKVFSQKEKLKEIDLDIPEATKLLSALKNNGFDVDVNIYDLQSTVDEILSKIVKVK
ncbi:MAG: energy-coupling factor transporter ATPase [Lachnospirales bacterium]